MAYRIGCNLIPSAIALSGMPLTLEVSMVQDTDLTPVALHRFGYVIRMDGNVLFEGVSITDVKGLAYVQIGEILDQLPAPELSEDVFRLSADLRRQIAVTVSAEGAARVSTETVTIVYGRIDRRTQYWLDAQNSNIFSYKFLNPTGNCLSGTRTTLYRSELMPLMGIGTGDVLIVSGGGKQQIYQTEYLVPFNVDLRQLLEFGDNIAIRQGASSAGCTYHILEDPAGDSVMFKYRNTFGVWERFLATGVSYSYPSVFGESIQYYDKRSDNYLPVALHPTWQMNRTIATGYLTPDRVPGVIALLLSDEVYMIREGVCERVQVTCGDKIPDRIYEPINITLSLLHPAGETGYLPSQGHGTARIHTYTHNETYN